MIRAAFSSLAGAWIARNVKQGEIPERFAVPLTLLATRLPTPVILVGAIGYGLYRLGLEMGATRAKDVSPKRRAGRRAQQAKSPGGRARTRRTSEGREVPDA